MTFDEFKKDLELATTEEVVKATYAKFFDLKYNTSHNHDLYTSQVLFEFKTDKKFENIKALATVLAQSLYYIRKLRFDKIKEIIPPSICLADKNNAVLTDTRTWASYYSNNTYDWDRAPSNPDPKLVDHLVKETETRKLHIYKITQKTEHEVFKKRLLNALSAQATFDFGDKKIINEDNFEAVFSHWKDIIGRYIENGYKPSFYFLSNIQKDKITIDRENNRIFFTFEDKKTKFQKIIMENYDYFWRIYEYVSDAETINGIHAKLDRLTDESQRRFEGEFYTPLLFAKKAIHCWNKVLGSNWYKTGKYRIWDMAAGTGNLEYHLPAEAYKYLYLSTLHEGDSDHLKKVFPGATCFQYDYLNDDVDYLFQDAPPLFKPNWKLPKKLRDELADPSITWIVFINPPFATAQDAKAGGRAKKGVSKTRVEQVMSMKKAKHAKRELFAQFMFRIVNELPKNTFLGMFSTLKYLNAPDSVEYRKTHFNFKYERGFLFHSKCFQGVTGDFPIAFLVWNLSKPGKEDFVDIDILDNEGSSIGMKHLRLLDKCNVLNNWFERPQNSKNHILPALSNAITVKFGNVDTRHRARPDFLASICSKGNDFQNAKYVTILSSPSASAGAFTVTSENFEKALVLYAVRKIPKPTWLNDRDQFLIPHRRLDESFINDCVIWSLFSNTNQTAALRNVSYRNQIYQITNNFFPFSIKELQHWEITDPDIKDQLLRAEDRFVARWISTNEFSDEAKLVLEKARIAYEYFYKSLNKLSTKNWKIETWDAGWYQIRQCLEEHNLATAEIERLTEASRKLASKLLPSIYRYGFMVKDEIYG